MDIEAFTKTVSFRWFGTDAGLKWYLRLNHRLAKLGLSLETMNTLLPADRQKVRFALRKLTKVPKMSTYAIGAIIDKAVSLMPQTASFVNVGVWNGFSFLAGIGGNPMKRCIAVDNFSQFGGPRDEFAARFAAYRTEAHKFYDMDYEEYFAKVHQGLIGVYIYDGEHSYHNQLRGLEVAEPFFANGCVVLVDDTNDPEPRQATLDFIHRAPDKYRLVFDRRTPCNQHPTFWNGVMVFVRQADAGSPPTHS